MLACNSMCILRHTALQSQQQNTLELYIACLPILFISLKNQSPHTASTPPPWADPLVGSYCMSCEVQKHVERGCKAVYAQLLGTTNTNNKQGGMWLLKNYYPQLVSEVHSGAFKRIHSLSHCQWFLCSMTVGCKSGLSFNYPGICWPGLGLIRHNLQSSPLPPPPNSRTPWVCM